MNLALTERFQRDVKDLEEEQRAAVFEAILSLPRAIGESHLHSGLGIRKLHRSGIWEARLGLGLRLVFAIQKEVLTLVRVGTHQDIQRYLRTL